MLMVRRAVASEFMGGAYVFPGGSVDDDDVGPAADAVTGDDPGVRPWHAAALRELAEEADLLITAPPATTELTAAAAGKQGRALYSALVGAGFRLDASGLAYLSNWVTPLGPSRRFDTRFFVLAVPADATASPDRHEVTDAVWVTPAEAIANADAGDWDLPFPTRSTLEWLSGFTTPDAAVEGARTQEAIPRIAPRIGRDADGDRVILMEGDPGYEDAPV